MVCKICSQNAEGEKFAAVLTSVDRKFANSGNQAQKHTNYGTKLESIETLKPSSGMISLSKILTSVSKVCSQQRAEGQTLAQTLTKL